MRAVIQRYKVSGNEELWSGDIPVAPRVDEFITIDADDAAVVVERVDWDYSVQPIQLCIIVR